MFYAVSGLFFSANKFANWRNFDFSHKSSVVRRFGLTFLLGRWSKHRKIKYKYFTSFFKVGASPFHMLLPPATRALIDKIHEYVTTKQISSVFDCMIVIPTMCVALVLNLFLGLWCQLS